MLCLKDLVSGRGLEAKRKKNINSTGLQYFYELYIIENEIISKSKQGCSYIKIGLLDLILKTRKSGVSSTYGYRRLREEIIKHLTTGGYTWYFKCGFFLIGLEGDRTYEIKTMREYKDWLFFNFCATVSSILPASLHFTITGKTWFTKVISIVGLIFFIICIIEVLVDTLLYGFERMLYKGYIKRNGGF